MDELDPESKPPTQRIYLRRHGDAPEQLADDPPHCDTLEPDDLPHAPVADAKKASGRALAGRLKSLFDKVTRSRLKHPLSAGTRSETHIDCENAAHQKLTSASTHDMQVLVEEVTAATQGASPSESSVECDVTRQLGSVGVAPPLLAKGSSVRSTFEAATCENTTDPNPARPANMQQLQVINERAVCSGSSSVTDGRRCRKIASLATLSAACASRSQLSASRLIRENCSLHLVNLMPMARRPRDLPGLTCSSTCRGALITNVSLTLQVTSHLCEMDCAEDRSCVGTGLDIYKKIAAKAIQVSDIFKF